MLSRSMYSNGVMRTMRAASICSCVAIALVAAAQQSSRGGNAGRELKSVAHYGALPLAFEKNQGQAAADVRFLAHGDGYSLFLTDQEAVLALRRRTKCALAGAPTQARRSACAPMQAEAGLIRMKLAGVATDAAAGADRGATLGEDELPGKVNYFIGSDPAQWHSDLATYGKVRYSGVYPGIDLVYYGNQRQLEYDFVVAPGASPKAIRLAFSGQKELRIEKGGDLVLESAVGRATLRKPVVYQEGPAGQHEPVDGSFKLLAGNTVGFVVGGYDRGRRLVIDPILVYSTYLGGTGTELGGSVFYWSDQANGIAVDSAGATYVVGSTGSTNFPLTSGAYQKTNRSIIAKSNGTAFVSKLNAAGTALVYSTYLGGTGLVGGYGDIASAVAVDALGDAYVTGATFSSDFPVTSGALQKVNKSFVNRSSTAFVTKLNPSGSGLLYSTYLGGTNLLGANVFLGGDWGTAIAVNASGNAYIAGYTHAADFPVTAGVLQTKFAGQTAAVPPLGTTVAANAFVTELSAGGSAAVSSTYLGGSGVNLGLVAGQTLYGELGDRANGIALDSFGDIFVAGQTFSADFPVTSGAFQTTNKATATFGSNAFVTKLNPAMTSEVYSTYLGGSTFSSNYISQVNLLGSDSANAIALDSAGSAYVAGLTNTSDFPMTTAIPWTVDGYFGESFVTRLSADGAALAYSIPLGGGVVAGNVGGGFNAAYGLAVDSAGYAYVAGTGWMGTFPETSDAIVKNAAPYWANPTECILVKVNPSGMAREFSSLFGGPSNSSSSPIYELANAATALAIDGSGNVYMTGYTSSNIFPVTSGAFQTSNRAATGGGATNAFVSKFALAGETTDSFATKPVITISSPTVVLGQPVTVSTKVAVDAGGTTPTGQVGLSGWYLPSATVTLDGTGSATWVMDTSGVVFITNSFSLGGTYSGDATHLTSYGTISFTMVSPPVSLQAGGPLTQTVPYGKPFSNLVVRALDSTLHALVGVPINFSGAGLQFTPPTMITDAGGFARAAVQTITPGIGSLVATATLGGAPSPVTFTLKTTAAPLTVTVHGAARLYGAANPAFINTFTGLANGDSITVTDSTTANLKSPLGTYPVTAAVSNVPAYYSPVTVVNSTMQVLPAPLIVLARSEASFYGKTPAQPTAYFFTGFVNGETASVVSGAPVLSTSVTATTPAGAYPITVQVGTLSAANYTFKTTGAAGGSVQVYKVPLIVLAGAVGMTYGQTPPPLTSYRFAGFVNGDTASVVSGAPLLSTPATSASKVGNYPITLNVGTLAASSYYFTPVNGYLTVTP